MKIIYVKLIKPWGQYTTGDIVPCGESKGRTIIAQGRGVEVPAPKAEKKTETAELKVEAKPVVETATAEPSIDNGVETADVTPRKRGRPAGRKDGD